jgi:hypothetical protein
MSSGIAGASRINKAWIEERKQLERPAQVREQR